MIKILHQINILDELESIDPSYGVEVDIHAFGDKLTVHHNAFSNGVPFDKWLSICSNRFVIFNIKEEGIETRVRDMAIQSGISNFFLLDLSFPALIRISNEGESRVAIRVSEYECVNSALLLQSKIDWVWLDCFDGFPLTIDESHSLNNSSLKICLVSPELHGYPRTKDNIYDFKKKIHLHGLKVDAVCTKFPELW
jgi:hypothetical protein